jgi:hypothetical protein
MSVGQGLEARGDSLQDARLILRQHRAVRPEMRRDVGAARVPANISRYGFGPGFGQRAKPRDRTTDIVQHKRPRERGAGPAFGAGPIADVRRLRRLIGKELCRQLMRLA